MSQVLPIPLGEQYKMRYPLNFYGLNSSSSLSFFGSVSIISLFTNTWTKLLQVLVNYHNHQLLDYSGWDSLVTSITYQMKN